MFETKKFGHHFKFLSNCKKFSDIPIEFNNANEFLSLEKAGKLKSLPIQAKDNIQKLYFEPSNCQIRMTKINC